jgi:transposase InsO family protein
VDLILQIRREKGYGAPRLSWHLQRHHNIYISCVTIGHIFRRHHIPRAIPHHNVRVSPPVTVQKQSPGERVQVDVKFLPKLAKEHRRYYQFTAIDDCTRYRVLQIYSHNSTKSALAFIEKLREKLPFAIKEIQTDHGSEFATPFTWHLNDLGITHRRIYPGCPNQNGKVERSHRTDEEEFYRRYQFNNAQELETRIEEWEKEYNFNRPHMALKGLTPGEKLHKMITKKSLQKSVQEATY